MFKVNDLCRRKFQTTERIIKYISSEIVVVSCPLTNKESVYERKVFEDTFELKPDGVKFFVFSYAHLHGKTPPVLLNYSSYNEAVEAFKSIPTHKDLKVSPVKEVTLRF